MNKIITLIVTLASTISPNVFAEKSHEDAHKFRHLNEVIKDSYFSTTNCGKYIDTIPLLQRDIIKRYIDLFVISDIIVNLEGHSIRLADIEKELVKNGLLKNSLLDNPRNEIKNFPSQFDHFSDDTYSPQRMLAAGESLEKLLESYEGNKSVTSQIGKYSDCRVVAVALGKSRQTEYIEKYTSYVKERPDKAKIGYFYVSAENFSVSKQVKTGNPYTEPKQWEDSRFLIINTSFKNLDTESRLPVEGSLFINYDGKDYEFDAAEPILEDGYNIWLKQINPLITMKTKIVYRIPNEIHGEVFWRPGRNSNDTRLWLGFIEAQK